jgi:hypothetical protein
MRSARKQGSLPPLSEVYYAERDYADEVGSVRDSVIERESEISMQFAKKPKSVKPAKLEPSHFGQKIPSIK